MPEILDAGFDLLLGSACCVCGAPGRPLCRACDRALPQRARSAWPSPAPPGLVRPVAVGDYAGPLRDLVLAHKEHGRLALARPLGRLLAVAVAEASESTGVNSPPVLVPVPAHPQVVRARGHDPLLRVVRHAAGVLRGEGLAVRVRSWLRVHGRPQDQAGLDTVARAANLRGRFRAVRRGGDGPVVVVDDVITTGATLREAQRALEDAGFTVVAAATVAATRRTSRPAVRGTSGRTGYRQVGGEH